MFFFNRDRVARPIAAEHTFPQNLISPAYCMQYLNFQMHIYKIFFESLPLVLSCRPTASETPLLLADLIQDLNIPCLSPDASQIGSLGYPDSTLYSRYLDMFESIFKQSYIEQCVRRPKMCSCFSVIIVIGIG